MTANTLLYAMSGALTLFAMAFIRFLTVKFPLTPMGVLAPVSAQRDTPLSPPSTSAEIFRRTCLHSNLQTSPPTPKNAYAKF